MLQRLVVHPHGRWLATCLSRRAHLLRWLTPLCFSPCHAVILDCADNNVAFYEKVGFKPKERQMALYLMSKT